MTGTVGGLFVDFNEVKIIIPIKKLEDNLLALVFDL